MKRFLTLLLSSTLLVSLVSVAAAAVNTAETTYSHDPEVAIEMEIGESITITATTTKQGDDYTVTGGWAHEDVTEAVYGEWITITITPEGDEDTYYDSTLTFTPTVPGEYLITYKIVMSAGESENTWESEATWTIIVTEAGPDSCGNVNAQGHGAYNGDVSQERCGGQNAGGVKAGNPRDDGEESTRGVNNAGKSRR